MTEPPGRAGAAVSRAAALVRTHPVAVLAVAGFAMHLYFNTLSRLSELQMSALHFGFFGLLAAIFYPARVAVRPLRLGTDVLVGGLALTSGLYFLIGEDALYARGMNFSTADWVFAVAAVAVAVELTRRTTGPLIPILILVALSYVVWWGRLLDGAFAFPGLSVETVLMRAYFTEEGLFGSIARISWSTVYVFVLFGAFLLSCGAGEVIIALGRAAAGRFRGGPGFVAVISSGLMGSISGSAIANTATTGVITIPLMKRNGFSARFAAGVETAASTGGQLMPPIMGAGAFAMASLTGISYLTIVEAALLPALLYFLTVAFYVRFEAVRRGLGNGDAEPGETISGVLKRRGAALLPVLVLIVLLILGFTPTYAGLAGMASAVAASWAAPHPVGGRAVVAAIVNGTRAMTATAVLLVAIGLIVNVVSTTGLGNTFSLMVNAWSGGNLYAMLALVAVASLILGMGLPVTAAYIVLATLSAPAIAGLIGEAWLIEAITGGTLDAGARAILTLAEPSAAALLTGPVDADTARALIAAVPPEIRGQLTDLALTPAEVAAALLIAHMTVFWLSQDSNLTPPVCLAAYTAAGIAGSAPMATGVAAWRIGKGLYLVPLLFVATPLIAGSWAERLAVFGFALAGLYAVAGAIQGALEGRLGWPARGAALVAGAALLWPDLPLAARAAALAVLAALIWWSRKPAIRPSCNVTLTPQIFVCRSPFKGQTKPGTSRKEGLKRAPPHAG